MVYAPGTQETDPKKQNRSLQANAAATATNTTNIATNTSGIAANTAAIAALAPIASSGSAADLSAGTVPTARLGSGSATAATFLAGDQSYKAAVTSVAAGAGLSGGTITGTGTVALALTNATLQTNLSDPTGTTSSGGVFKMMGLGGVATLTPVYSTRIKLEFVGFLSNTGTGATAAHVVFGTGAAPANAAAATGTIVGNSVQSAGTAAAQYPFNASVIITGLTPSTAYWFDLGLSVASGTGTVKNLSCNAMEF